MRYVVPKFETVWSTKLRELAPTKLPPEKRASKQSVESLTRSFDFDESCLWTLCWPACAAKSLKSMFVQIQDGGRPPNL